MGGPLDPKGAVLRDLIRELNAHRVECLVVGDYAAHRYIAAREADGVAG